MSAKLMVGLCETCNNAENCVYRKRRGADALFCEMFDCSTTTNGKAAGRLDKIAPLKIPVAVAGNLKGLCVNCAHAETCSLSKPEGGVWHCEEYQ